MENTQFPEVNKNDIVMPPNTLNSNLENAFKDVIEQIRYCDEQVAAWQEKKRELQNIWNEAVERTQKQFGKDPEKKKKIHFDKTSTISDMILSYLEKNGPTRARDIRKFLLLHGKKTNPGVALSRMVKKGDLKHSNRGIYKI